MVKNPSANLAEKSLFFFFFGRKIPLPKNLSANAGNMREACLIPGSGRYPGVGNVNSLQYSCLENSMDREAWWAIVHRVAKSEIGRASCRERV